MLFCPHCQQLEPTTHESRDDGSVAYRCKKCGGDIPLRRDLRPGEIVAGFEIEEELGRGAMGIVYQARQTNLDREVAIKILSDDSASDEVYVERFFREARAAASLSHPNVVQAYDAGVTEDGIYYFVMEKITGENLELVLKNVGPLNVSQALDVFLSVANALAYAWSHNQLSHGDIKPENIIMRLNGKVKLADFGLARRAKDPELAEDDIRATPAYAPPEIINGDKNVPGFKSDMYSFGATAYHILIGHEPFVDADPMKVCAMQLTEVQMPLSELNPNIPRRLSDLVDALMEKDPENRPACWEDVVSELQAIRDSIEAGAGAHRSRRDHDGSGKKPLPLPTLIGLVVAGLLVLALIAGGAVYFARHGASRPPVGPQEPRPSRQDPSQGDVSVPSQTGPAEVRDEAYFLAKWQTIQKDFSGSEPDLKRVEAFVAEAGHLAPAESVKLLQSLHARLDPDQTTNRVLMLRNSLLDRAGAFKPDEAEEMDFFAVADLCETVKKQIDELKTLDASLKEHLLQPEQLQTIEAYYAKLAALLVDKSLTSSVGDEPATDEPATPVPAEQTGATEDEPVLPPGVVEKPARNIKDLMAADDLARAEAKRVLSLLNTAIRNESERPVLIRGLNALLADPAFTDEELRKDCIDARRFLVLNQSALLPYLTSNLAALKGMVLFPKSNPDSRLEDISDGTFRLRIVNRDGSITQRLKWSDIRREEGEDAIIVTLINSPQLQKLSADFREFLFVRALFYGVKPEALRARYDRASGLPAEKRDELYRTAELFQERPLTVDDLIDALGELLNEDISEEDFFEGEDY